MATVSMLSLLITAICGSLVLGIDSNYLFDSDQFPDAASVPTLSNGFLGFTVFSDNVYLAGVYNGRGSQSHRARIPNYANLQLTPCSQPETNPPYCSYQLDIKFGRFRTVYDDPNGQMRLIHSVYPHRFFNRVVVNHFRIQRLQGQGVLSTTILQAARLPSADISFQPVESVVVRDQTFMFQCGRTNEVEDPVLQTAGSEVCVYYSEIPTAIELPVEETAVEFTFYTVFARSRTEATTELQWLPMGSASGAEESHARQMSGMWDKYGITVNGNDELDRAIKASAFLLFSNVPHLNTRNSAVRFGISPSGIGRDDFQGHIMWDYDMWMFPIVLLTDPLVAREMLDYRVRTLRIALASNAAMINNVGWKYPWASAFTGREVSSIPGAAEQLQHITADVAFSIRQFMYATDNLSWMTSQGCELVYETARFWVNRTVYNSATDKFDIRSVTGPDTMNPNVNNNVFTNVVAANNLFLGEYAGCICRKGLTIPIRDDDLKEMIRKARSLHLLYDSTGDYNPQFEGYAAQQIAQADAVLLAYPLDLPMENSTKRRNLEMYGQSTAASSPAMTWAMHTIGWLELDELNLASENLRRSYQPYLRAPFNVWNQSPTGLPGAPNYVSGAASFLHTMINGYGGIRLRDGELVINKPRLPPGTTRLYIPNLNYNWAQYALEINQNGRFTLHQQAMPAQPQVEVIVDGQQVQPCGINTACVYHGSQSATLRMKRSSANRCELKPTTLNMKLADQNHGVTTGISPMVFITIVVASVLSKLW